MERIPKEEFIIGDLISISTGGLVGLSCVVSSMLHGHIKEVTEKTIKIQCDKNTCWLPKKALRKHPKHDYYTLTRARWFRPSTNQQWFLDKYSDVSGQSNA